MGIATSCNIAFFTRELDLINRYYLEGRADGFIHGLITGGGATFDPTKYGEFTNDEIKIMKIYFDQKSLSVSEGYTRPSPNVQDPEKLYKIWTKIKARVITDFSKTINDYRLSLVDKILDLESQSSKKNSLYNKLFTIKAKADIPELRTENDENKFNRLIFDFTWSLNSISKVMAGLEIAIKNDHLVEITVSDW